MSQPEPTIVAFHLADQVFRQCDPDGKPGKWCVIGIFDTFMVPSFPAFHPSLGLYVKVGNAEGEYSVLLEITDSQGQTVARLPELRINTPDRTERGGFGVQIGMLPLPKEGKYFISALFNGKPVTGDCFFYARLRPVST